MSADSASVTVSVVLPCLDEAESVGRCVTEARHALAAGGFVGEVVVVDNGSTDGSPDIARGAGARVVHESQRGYGSALRAGFAAAHGDIVVMADADLTYDFAQLPALVTPVADGDADLVMGSRLGSATRATMPSLHRFVGTPVLSFLTARACGRRPVRDSQSGFRAFRRGDMVALGLQSTGMELATEMLIRASRRGFRIREIETGYAPRVGDSKLSTFADGWRHLRLIFLLAPDLLLVGPGAALVAVGTLLLALDLVFPSGVDVGSLRWQPVFFSGIALVLGVQAMLGGAVIAHHSWVVAPGVRRRFAFLGRPDMPNKALAAGVASVLVGLALNLVLFVRWLGGDPSPPSSRGLGLASLSEALIIVGGTVAGFGLVSRFQTPASETPGTAREADDRTPTAADASTAPTLSATPRP